MDMVVPVFIYLFVESNNNKFFVTGRVYEDLSVGDDVITFDNIEQRTGRKHYRIVGIQTARGSAMTSIAKVFSATLELEGSEVPHMYKDPDMGVVGYLYKEIDEEDEGTETTDI